MSKYRKIDPRIWNDAKFNDLSSNAKLVFFLLLTHPHLTALGAMRASIAGLANDLRFTEKAFRESLGECFQNGLIKHDERACFVWLPNYLKYNKPGNPNVLSSWGTWLDYLPECSLKSELIQSVKSLAEGMGESYTKALPESFENDTRNLELEHELELELEKHIRQVAVATGPVCLNKKSKLAYRDEIVEVFEYWQHVMNHPNAKLDDKRKRKIQAALKKLKFSVDQLKLAIDGCAKSKFHMGDNPEKKRHDGIDLIFRSAEKIEEFMRMAEAATVTPGMSALKPPSEELMRGVI